MVKVSKNVTKITVLIVARGIIEIEKARDKVLVRN